MDHKIQPQQKLNQIDEQGLSCNRLQPDRVEYWVQLCMSICMLKVESQKNGKWEAVMNAILSRKTESESLGQRPGEETSLRISEQKLPTAVPTVVRETGLCAYSL